MRNLSEVDRSVFRKTPEERARITEMKKEIKTKQLKTQNHDNSKNQSASRSGN
jgi:hypothetical protein